MTNHTIAGDHPPKQQHFSGLVIAGKMHRAGVDEPVADLETVSQFDRGWSRYYLAPAVGGIRLR